MSAEAIRAFVALPCPSRLQAAIAETLARWRSVDAAVRWAHPEHVHLTLRFLADAPPARLERLDPALRTAAAASGPLELRPAPTGAFPGWDRPRVLWLGIEARAELAQLAEAVEAVAREAGFEPEERGFRPHLTLGRVKGTRGARRAAAAVRGWEPGTGAEAVAEMILFRSDLSDRGPRHTALARYPLRPA